MEEIESIRYYLMFGDGMVMTTVSLFSIFPEKDKKFAIGRSDYVFTTSKVIKNLVRKTELVVIARTATTFREFQDMLRKQRDIYKMVMPFEPVTSDELKEFKNTYLSEEEKVASN